MKFKMNGRDWNIKEVCQKKMQELENDENEKNTYYGLTVYDNQTIYIWEDLHPQQKKANINT